MVFCEQKLLWQLIKELKLEHKYLFNQTLVCHRDKWVDNSLGLFSYEDQYDYAVHFGPDKRRPDDRPDYYRERTQDILETFYKHFPHLNKQLLNMLTYGHT